LHLSQIFFTDARTFMVSALSDSPGYRRQRSRLRLLLDW
jgi:hypothetical protein